MNLTGLFIYILLFSTSLTPYRKKLIVIVEDRRTRRECAIATNANIPMPMCAFPIPVPVILPPEKVNLASQVEDSLFVSLKNNFPLLEIDTLSNEERNKLKSMRTLNERRKYLLEILECDLLLIIEILHFRGIVKPWERVAITELAYQLMDLHTGEILISDFKKAGAEIARSKEVLSPVSTIMVAKNNLVAMWQAYNDIEKEITKKLRAYRSSNKFIKCNFLSEFENMRSRDISSYKTLAKISWISNWVGYPLGVALGIFIVKNPYVANVSIGIAFLPHALCFDIYNGNFAMTGMILSSVVCSVIFPPILIKSQGGGVNILLFTGALMTSMFLGQYIGGEISIERAPRFLRKCIKKR